VAGLGCIEIATIGGPQEAGSSFLLTAAGPSETIRGCPASFDVNALGVDVQADAEYVVLNRAFPADYKVVRVPGS
jgi:hypothetical protein